MKHLLFFLGIILSTSALADCMSSGIWVYPKGGTLVKNSLFFIEGYYYDQEKVRDFGKGTHAYLVNGDSKIELETVQLYEGMMHLTTAVMKPSSTISSKRAYHLLIEDEEGNEEYIKEYDGRNHKWHKIFWKIADKEDTSSPSWEQEPTFEKTDYVAFGCGPAVNALFNAQLSDQSKTFVVTEVKNLTAEESNTYLLNIEGNTLSIGHGMCSGAFKYKEKHKYAVRFKLMDICGNENEEWTEWTNFKNPLKGNTMY